MRGWIAAVVSLVVATEAIAAPQAGEPYVSEAGNYRVRLPGTPKSQDQVLNSPAGPVSTSTALYETPDRKASYAVAYTELPAQATQALQGLQPAKVDAILDGCARGMTSYSGSTIRERTSITFGGHPGLDIMADAPPKGGDEPVVCRARALLIGNRLYQILLVGPKSRAGPGDFEAFRDSFSLIRNVPAIARVDAGAARPMPAAPPRPIGPRSAPAFAGSSGPDPAGPAEVEIRVDYDTSKAVDRIRPGGFNDNPFRDIAPPGGVLVGVRVGYVQSFGGSKVGSVRPIYQVGARYVEGETAGNPAAGLGEAQAVAKPGYVVAGINYRAGLLIDAVQLIFGRVKAGRVDLRDAYTSPWLGSPDGGTLMFVSGEGRFIAGVVGRSNGREINGIGLSVVMGASNAKVTTPPPGSAPPKPSTPVATAPRPEVTPRSFPAPTFGPAPMPPPRRVPRPRFAPSILDPSAVASASRRPAPVAIAVDYDPSRLADVPPSNDDGREGFRDVAPRGGVLVGVRVGTVDAFGGEKVGAIQPIYQVGRGYVPGRRFGVAVVRGGSTVMARPGYAVGAIHIRSGLIVDGVRLVFMRVEGNRLDPADTYTSDWLGDPSGGGYSTASGEGRPLVGLRGRSDANMLKALGAVVAQ